MRVSGAIPERVVVAYEDALGNPVDVSSANALPVTSGGGGGASQVEVVDENGNPINVANPFPVVDVNHEDLVLLLTRMLSVLGRPVNYDPALNRQRMTTILESGTVTTVSTVTTAGTLTNVGAGRAGIELQDNANRSAWALVHRTRIT